MLSKRSLVAGAGAVGATLSLLLSGCSDVGTEAGEHDHATHEHEPTSQPADGAQAHNEADVTFAREMVPHHEQAVVMSDIILGKQGIDPRVTQLATEIKNAQGPEIATMKGWLTQWGASAPSGHEGHDMGGGMGGDPSAHAAMGMMTEAQLEQLRQAQGVDAARQFLTGMIAHHEGAVDMAQTEVDTGQAEDAVTLARQIIETQQREIDTMKGILGSL
ncbi:uncharacterized protein (DUF305 family) [Mycolicibacterium iranicum]|uniref:Uncharacterized protein (DUF305 family) n=1 Tax=Mycolicibacterium iranicum TaxID=912594 RepID=A0A839QB83_MYCIR|nr:DUF305 domain-containing protein [Mycolicibacterium iranicum]MBB2993398.1 uncharacterized protein (DUF305 family) [Mycolicibacterium iranicum]